MSRTLVTPTFLGTSFLMLAATTLAPVRILAQAPAHLLYTAAESSIYSSSLPTEAIPTPEAAEPEPEPTPADSRFAGLVRPVPPPQSGVSAFHDAALSIKVGSAGIGFDVATPLTRRMNLRTGASFFSYSPTFTTDGLNIAGSLKFQNASASVDIYPFNGSFRISPGITFRNNNKMNALITVPGGQNFSLGDGNYTSSPTDPIHGTAAFAFGTSNFAPRLTAGFGNMIPRKGGRISFPVEVGFQYISQPTAALSFSGTACNNQGCGPVQQSDVAQEQTDLNNDLAPLRFYPIASIGISYRLGASHLSR